MPLEDTSVKKALLDFIECPEYNNSSKIKKKRNIYGDEKETLMKVKEYMKISRPFGCLHHLDPTHTPS